MASEVYQDRSGHKSLCGHFPWEYSEIKEGNRRTRERWRAKSIEGSPLPQIASSPFRWSWLWLTGGSLSPSNGSFASTIPTALGTRQARLLSSTGRGVNDSEELCNRGTVQARCWRSTKENNSETREAPIGFRPIPPPRISHSDALHLPLRGTSAGLVETR